MAGQNSFDIVSKINMQEVDNAVNQSMREVLTRFDFKGSRSRIQLEGKEKIFLIADDEFKLKSLNDIFQQKLVKRGVPLKNVIYEKVQSAANGTVVQEVILQSGLSSEKAKEVVKVIKLSKLRVQTAINGDQVRVSSKDRDSLQEVIKLLKSQDFDFDVQFSNYRNQ